MYRYLQVYYGLLNDVYKEFNAEFEAVTCIVAVVMLYASVKAFKLVSLVLYLLFPLTLLMSIVCLTSVNGFIYLIDRKSSRVLSSMKVNATKTTTTGIQDVKILRMELRAVKRVRLKVGTFGYMCLEVPKAEMEQTCNYILLLSEY